MAIKKHEDLQLTDRISTTTSTTTQQQQQQQQQEPSDEVSAPESRSQTLERYSNEYQRQRSLIFSREHTHLRRNPAMITCPNCLQSVETIVERRCSSTTHLSALLLLPVCFCALPYCSKMLRDSIHRCPSCGIALGAHFASAHEAFVTCCMHAQHDHQHVQGRSAASSGEAQFF